MLLEEEKDLNNQQEEVNNAAEETAEETTAAVEETPVAEAEPEVTAAVETPEADETPATEEEPAAQEEVKEPAPAARQVEEPVAEEEEEEVELPEFEPVVAGGAHDDFNWNMDKRGAIAYTSAEKTALLKQYDETLKSVAENEIIRGRVSAISGGDVVLDINYKSDGLIPMSEFRDTPGLAQGDEVEVYVESQEDSQGQLGLSRRKAKILRAWESIVDSFKNGTIIRGTVISKTKGGLIVDCNGLETFLPGSQIDIKPVIDYDQYVGKMMEFKVVKVNEQIKNAVVSHKALIESDLAEQREQILGSLDKGQVLEGIVKNITDFGAFLDLGGVDGLLYITDISWGRIGHPSEMVQIDQEIEVMVLHIDLEKKKIALGLKQKQPSPWEHVADRYPVGSRHKGEVVNVMSYGAFVKLEEGIEGLVHISEMSWTKRISHPNELVHIGDEIEVVVLGINKEKQEISLGMKQTQDNPWDKVADRYPPGTMVTGTVRNLTNYGAFIEIEEGIDGLLHVSDMSWTRKISHPSEMVEKGDKLECRVISVDQQRRRIALGLKQLQDDPWATDIPSKYQPGQVVKGKVTKLTNFGVFVGLENGLEGLLHISELSDQKVENPEDVVKVGDDIEVKILRVDTDERKIGLSRKRVDWANEDLGEEATDGSTTTAPKMDQSELKGGVGESGPLFKTPGA